MLPVLQMTVLTDILGFMKFCCEFTTKNRSLVHEIGILHNVMTDEQAACNVVED